MKFFEQLAVNLSHIDINILLENIFAEANIESWIVDIIKKRLYNVGIDSKGQKLKTDSSTTELYSNFTLDIKERTHQRTSNVTLKDSGDFYNSMKIILLQNGFQIDADFVKKNGNIYKNFTKIYSSQKDFENSIMSLGLAEMKILMEIKVIPKLKAKIKAKIHEYLH